MAALLLMTGVSQIIGIERALGVTAGHDATDRVHRAGGRASLERRHVTNSAARRWNRQVPSTRCSVSE